MSVSGAKGRAYGLSFLNFRFPVSGVETFIFMPSLIMLAVSTLTSMSGVSGAFVLLPIQMSAFGYTAPGVTATNFIYNIVAIPIGVLRYVRERRISWSLFAVLAVGGIPGTFLGYLLRVLLLPDPETFKLFVAAVLAYLAFRVVKSILRERRAGERGDADTAVPPTIEREKIGIRRCTITTPVETYRFPTVALLLISFSVGIVGGAYGIGGGSIIVPVCVSMLNLPVFVVSGAALLMTWITSILAAVFYSFVTLGTAVNTRPDLLLGLLFGLGGTAGIYLGTRLQRRVPSGSVKTVLAIAITFLAAKYLFDVSKAIGG